MNGSRCGTQEMSSCSGSVETAFGVPGEREPLSRDAVSEELGPTSRGAGTAEAGIILYLPQPYRSQSFVESAELAAETEKVQSRENAPGNARKGS